MKCPICGQTKTVQIQKEYGEPLVTMDAPSYQISYKGQREYVPPRCGDCVDRVLERQAKGRI